MKKLIGIVLVSVACIQLIHAQDLYEKFNSFRQGLMQQGDYFTDAEISSNNQLVLYATEKFNQLPESSRNTVMDIILASWKETLVIVKYGSKRSLWGWSESGSSVVLLDTWDVDGPAAVAASPAGASPDTRTKKALHPFFVYAGGQGQYSNDGNLNIDINTRVGFFLLMNRWDLAWTFSGGVLGNVNSDALNNDFITGLMSKFYFPIRKLNLSPNVGFDLQGYVLTSPESTSQSVTRSLLAGISWYVGSGSIDLGFRINKQVSASLGYTFIPRLRTAAKNR